MRKYLPFQEKMFSFFRAWGNEMSGRSRTEEQDLRQLNR
jgi:hypothetical protein